MAPSDRVITRPWIDAEMALVNGIRVTYTTKAGEIVLLHMHGCWSISPEAARKLGFAVIEPAQIREGD